MRTVRFLSKVIGNGDGHNAEPESEIANMLDIHIQFGVNRKLHIHIVDDIIMYGPYGTDNDMPQFNPVKTMSTGCLESPLPHVMPSAYTLPMANHRTPIRLKDS